MTTEQQNAPTKQSSNTKHVTDIIESDSDGSDFWATRHSKSQKTAGPHSTTIQYYPGSWKTVLEKAKDRFVWHVFINQEFPVLDTDLGVAQTILHDFSVYLKYLL